MKGRLVSPIEFNDWVTEIGNFGFGYTDFATGIDKKSNQKCVFFLFWQKLNWHTVRPRDTRPQAARTLTMHIFE